MSDDDDGEGCGYGKPPKSGQFKPGKSGNPAGRPKKNKAQTGPAFVDGLTSINQNLLLEGKRLVRVREGDQVFEMSQEQAVIRATHAKAIKGSPMAQRTIIAENQRVQALEMLRKQERWDFWQTYVAKWRAAAASAEARGRPPPDVLPHADDVEFTEDLGVRVLGPESAEELKSYRLREGFRDLFQVFQVYSSWWPTAHDDSDEHVDLWMFSCVTWNAALPPSLRLTSDELDRRWMELLAYSRPKLEERIKALCEPVGWPFKAARIVARGPAMIELRKLGLRRVGGIIVREPGFTTAKMKERMWADRPYEHMTNARLDLIQAIGLDPPASWVAKARAAILARAGTEENPQMR